MHLSPSEAPVAIQHANPETVRHKLDFLWLELTNRCNLHCVHCYTDSGPHTGQRDRLTVQDYESVMRQAFALGCRKIQLIGGEPQLNADFERILHLTKEIGFEFVEVFSNLTRLDEGTVEFAAENGVHFATSVYSDGPAAHDAITQVRSSHARTIRNLKKLIDADVETRAAIIVIDQDKAAVDRTTLFLRDLGVRHVRSSVVREFGRGEEILLQQAQMSGLCGHCWAGKLCVAPDGVAYPCVMSRSWPVGNVLENSLAEIVEGSPLHEMRQAIFDTVWLPAIASKRVSAVGANPHFASSANCAPEEPTCGPDTGAPDCAPEISAPQDAPAVTEECPQSCVPDESTCGPIACPQCCDPNLI